MLGSTGSVGVSTLALIAEAQTSGNLDVEITALTAGQNVALLAEQAMAMRAGRAVIANEALLPQLQARLAGSGTEAQGGASAIEAAGLGADWVMSAIVGAAGLKPTLAAARAGAIIALANKESLVCAGPALLAASRAAGGRVIPVDSEHSAIFQVLDPDCIEAVSKLVLTASGGPFRTWTRAQMGRATPLQAVTHPNWNMGAKISVDSATMMNKGLEMIEAAYLFAMPEEKVEVLVHPQSIIHSMVEYADGSTLAQLGAPDMRAPIACALAWPRRMAWNAPKLDLAAIGSLTFEAPDTERFPALSLAREAMRVGAGAPAALNAANEVAVEAFLARQIGFLDIVAVAGDTLERMGAGGLLGGLSMDEAMETDRTARALAREALLAFAPA